MSRLHARLDLPDGALGLDLGPGDAALVAPAAVAALSGMGLSRRERRRHRIHLDGRRLDRVRPALRVRRGLGLVVGAPVAGDVPIVDQLAAIVSADRARELVDRAPLLAGRGPDPAGILSGGERRILGWLRCLATEPRAVVLDAAGTGLDADALDWCGDVVETWRAQGVVVVVRPGRDEERAWAASR